MLNYSQTIKFMKINIRKFHSSNRLYVNVRTAVPKVTNNRSKALTYEQAQKPHQIGVTKAWNSWNSSNLIDENKNRAETGLEDFFIRKFVEGTWINLFASEIIIKRRQNLVVIAGIITQDAKPSQVYFLKSYTEELLERLFKRPFKMEIQTVTAKKDLFFKWI